MVVQGAEQTVAALPFVREGAPAGLPLTRFDLRGCA
jgi:hypothetical protein